MIQIEEYNKDWPKIFEKEKEAILGIIGQWIEAIEHIGSTSVPYLSAKPTIDMCIGIRSLEHADKYLLEPLQKELDYHYLPELEQEILERRYLQKLNKKGEHLFHIHILIKDGKLWNNHLKFRNYLINHPEESQTYVALKHMLKEKFPHDRKAYTEGKAKFISDILNKASP